MSGMEPGYYLITVSLDFFNRTPSLNSSEGGSQTANIFCGLRQDLNTNSQHVWHKILQAMHEGLGPDTQDLTVDHHGGPVVIDHPFWGSLTFVERYYASASRHFEVYCLTDTQVSVVGSMMTAQFIDDLRGAAP
jgi:hypothetical protein